MTTTRARSAEPLNVRIPCNDPSSLSADDLADLGALVEQAVTSARVAWPDRQPSQINVQIGRQEVSS